MRPGYIIIFISVFWITNLAKGQTDTTITQSQWDEDLVYLEQTVFNYHKNPTHSISKEELMSSFSSLKSRFRSLNSKQKLIELITIMSSIGDGHTTIRSYDIFSYLPIHVQWFEEGLRIIWSKTSLSDVLGYKIRAIDGIDISKVQELVNTMSPKGENNYLLIQWGQQWIRNIDVLHYLGIAKSDTEIIMLLEGPNGDSIKKTIPVLTKEMASQKWVCAYDPLPLYMQNSVSSLAYQFLEGAFYINFRSYPEKKEMKRKAKELIDILLKRKDVTKLIFDFRTNGGGDFSLGRLLIDQMKKSNVLDNLKVYAITGRSTYSAAMVNTLDLKKELSAFLLGEPPMQRPNGYSESHTFTLPNSKIRASLSSEYYKFQTQDLDEVVLDKYFKNNFDLLKKGRDEIIEWILEQ